MGVLHGLAGGSHRFGVIPALALPSIGLSASWLVLFGVGTVAAMVAFTSILGFIVHGMAQLFDKLYRVAIGIGCWWLFVGDIE